MPKFPMSVTNQGPILRAAGAALLLGVLVSHPASSQPSAARAQALAPEIHLPLALAGRFGPRPAPVIRPSVTPSAAVPIPPTPTPPTPTPAIPTPARRARLGRVSGAVYAELEPGARIAVADVNVSLVSLEDGSEIASSATDLHGAFHFPPLPAGTYGLCRSGPGFPGECVEPPVTLGVDDVVIQPIRIQPEPGVIHGRVSLREGEACRLSDPARDVHVWTLVELQAADGTPIGAPVRANALGEYVLAGLPLDGRFRIQARCEGGVAEARIVDPGENPRRIDLIFNNARPTLAGIEARIDGRGARVAAPGDTVEVEAMTRDANGDALVHDWYPAPGAGSLLSAEGERARWLLPEEPGAYALHVLVGDGRGGYARGALRLEVRERGGARFAGRVLDAESGAALAGAAVRVTAGGDTVEVRSEAGGQFALVAATTAESEAIVYVHRRGYAPLVAVRDGEAQGATYALAPLEGQVFAPSAPVTLVDRRPSVIRARQPGARVELPADSLLGIADGLRPTAMVTGTTGGPIIRGGGDGGPGQGFPDMMAQQGRSIGLDREGAPRHLDGYGTVSLAFHDASGQDFAPRPGTSLSLSVPVSATIAISAPTTAPIWFLDGATGYWTDTLGRADLVETPDGPMYLGSLTVPESPSGLVEQLYQIALPDGFNLTCVRIQPDATVRPGTTLRAEVRVGNTTLATYHQPIVLNQSLYPLLQIQKAFSLRLSLVDSLGQLIQTATTTVPLAARPVLPGEGAANVPAPYSACGAPIPMTIPLPADVAQDASGEPVFLTGLGFPDYAVQGVSYADVTNAYYAAVDPQNLRTSLSAWWQLNGFGVKGDAPGGSGELVAAYLNHNDLGFGREMHCLRTGAKVACWVANYGNPNFGPDTGPVFPGNADLAAGKNGPGATVTMEFTDVPDEPGRRFVTFYAYCCGGGGAQRQVSVDLDGSYPKPIPQVCAVCHGGRYDPIGPDPNQLDPLSPTVDDLDFGASFREWDLPSLRYTLGRDDTQLTSGELATLRGLNELVRDHTAPSAGISELLDGWYGPLGNPKPGPAPDLSFVPPGFVGPAQTALYRDVVAPSCRTCHVARGAGQDFNAYADELEVRRYAVESYVCGGAKSMPNAKLTFNNFWWSTNPHRPASLAAWDDGTTWTPAIGACR